MLDSPEFTASFLAALAHRRDPRPRQPAAAVEGHRRRRRRREGRPRCSSLRNGKREARRSPPRGSSPARMSGQQSRPRPATGALRRPMRTRPASGSARPAAPGRPKLAMHRHGDLRGHCRHLRPIGARRRRRRRLLLGRADVPRVRARQLAHVPDGRRRDRPCSRRTDRRRLRGSARSSPSCQPSLFFCDPHVLCRARGSSIPGRHLRVRSVSASRPPSRCRPTRCTASTTASASRSSTASARPR